MANILIADDERSICELLEITFRKDGHSRGSCQLRRSRPPPHRIENLRHRDFRYPHAGHEWRRAAGFRQGNLALHDFHSDHRRSHRGYRHRRGECRRRPLRHQGSRPARSVAPRRSAGGRNAAPQKRSGLSATGIAPPHRPGQHHRTQRPNARHFRPGARWSLRNPAAC